MPAWPSGVRGLDGASLLSAPTAWQALHGGLSNRSLARTLSGAPRIVLARDITIAGEKPHHAPDWASARGFMQRLDHELHRRGYTMPARLQRIVYVALGRRDFEPKPAEKEAGSYLSNHAPFQDWDALVEDLAEKGFTSALIPAGAKPKKRPYKLGTRPAWTKALADLRPPNADEKLARRHIIPSHFLGYAVERWQASPAEIGRWIQTTRIKHGELVEQAVGPTVRNGMGALELKRLVWRILINHRGNLWWGPSDQNTTIGFFAPHLEKALEEMRDAEASSKLTKELADSLIKGLPKVQGAGTFAKQWQEILDLLPFITQPKDPAKILARAEDAFHGLELDPSMIGDWPEVHKVMQYLEKVEPDGRQFSVFLDSRWENTIK